jgi:hypothetical protein
VTEGRKPAAIDLRWSSADNAQPHRDVGGELVRDAQRDARLRQALITIAGALRRRRRQRFHTKSGCYGAQAAIVELGIEIPRATLEALVRRGWVERLDATKLEFALTDDGWEEAGRVAA